MKITYHPELKAHLTVDEKQRVRHIRHSQEYWPSEQNAPRLSASDYLNETADILQIPKAQLKNLHKKVSFLDPREQGVEYQLSEEKHFFDSITVGYYQTFLNVPVWRRGLSVKIKQNPNRIVGATNNSEDDIHGQLPDQRTIDAFRDIFKLAAVRKATIDAGLGDKGEAGEDQTASFVLDVLRAKTPGVPAEAKKLAAAQADGGETTLLSGKFFVYTYDPSRRYAGKPSPPSGKLPAERAEEEQLTPIPALPPVSDKINASQSYLVGELILASDEPGLHGLVWLILVEPETRSILYIECMTCGVNGLVFRRDPNVKTGNLAITAASGDAVLNPQRDDVLLTNLDAPMAGIQNLRGTFVDIEELTIAHADPDVAPPTTGGADFDYYTRTNDFGAVNAYYHQTELFRTIEDLGFSHTSYFDGTTFPIPVDHRALGDVINAHWSPNGSGGTGHMCFALCDMSNTAQPLLRAVDPWVHWHEMGGHGTLGDHVGSGNLGFSHSAGDGLAALQMDPESQLRALELPERFRYAPFRPFTTERRFDRPVATWAWGSANDDGDYGSEQILATCHFRIYRSIGGDHYDLGRRRFASRMTTYLILRTTANLTPGTNPSDPETWCEEMQDTDLENWTSEGVSGGAYNKVIRWAFEKQGSYQPAGAPLPVTTPGAPPAVDVYIDDGRAGEYQFQEVHWHNASMWNRNSPDGLPGHQNAIEGATNYLYGKVKNRGTSAATNVTVRCFHSLPGAGLTWPNDFTEMTPAGGVSIPSVPANSAGEAIVGPFEWVPNVNVYGHDCTLMIASTAGDPSNIDNFTGAETIAEWRLVPNDNNVGQRNINLVPGGGGPEALVAALDGAVFVAGNSFNRSANMEIRASMPTVLASKGWRLQLVGLDDGIFWLKAGEKRRITFKLVKGKAFTVDEIRSAFDRNITVQLRGNGILLGGTTYQVDPDSTEPSGGRRPIQNNCQAAAEKLLDCLKLSDQKVKKACVTKVSLDIELDNDCDCE